MLHENPHAFLPPLEGESRGPCPALNTLANHGYLPRDGRNITREALLEALRNPAAYNVSEPLAQLLVHGGFALMYKFQEPSISLHELARHGYIEHNASVVHKDVQAGKEYAPTRCDTILLEDLMQDNSLTLDRVAGRRVLLEKSSPLDSLHQEIARGEWALVLDIFGREIGGEIPSGIMKVWLKENRFPEGWKPTHQQGLFETIRKASELRQKMDEFRKNHEELSAELAASSLESTQTCRSLSNGLL